MKNQSKTEIKVGLTVLLALLLFLWILGWAKNFSIRSSDLEVNIKFSNVAGLEIGDNVTVNGVRKGFVKEMKVHSGDVLVTVSIDKEVDLRDDAVFTLNMLDLMGGKRVEIYPGTSEKKLDNEKIFTGEFLSDIPSVMAVFGTVQDDLVAMLKDIRVTLSSMNSYLTDEKMESDIKKSLTNLSEVSRKLNLMIDENRESVKSITENAANLTSEATEFLNTNKIELTESVSKLKDVLTSTGELIVKLNELTDETTQQKNTLGKMLYDEKILNDLKSALDQLNKLATILVDQLQGKGIKVDANIF